jgi:DNA-binding MarR family transcriptional regulator
MGGKALQINKVDRFESFILLIDAIHKSINKIKTDIVPGSSIKSVHTMWLYELLRNPEGLTATEIANKTMIDKSLVSREIRALMKDGFVKSSLRDGKKSYNSVISLTEKGKALAEQIAVSALAVQETVSNDVGMDELSVFYSVLERLYKNIISIADKADAAECAAN